MIRIHVNGDKELKVFSSFVVDNNLPKHKKADKKMGSFVVANEGSGSVVFSSGEMDRKPTFSLWARIKKAFTRDPEKGKLPPAVIFARAKAGTKVLEDATARIGAFNQIRENALCNGQTALAEKVSDRIKLVELESFLHASDFKKYLDEEDLIVFNEACEKGLRLDWMKNFTRIIPKEIVDAKKSADELGVFDNYVILHFDPEGKSTQMTKDEVEKARDPILFGVIQRSRRLYYIADWIDELCNLTLDDIAEVVDIKEIPERESL